LGSAQTGSEGVQALLPLGADLVAGGGFAFTSRNIARWDGQAWQPYATGLGATENNRVRALAVYHGDLYAAGGLVLPSTPQGQSIGIARWDGAAWQTVGGAGLALIDSMVVHDDALYVAGVFNSIAGVNSPNLARWDGQGWSGVPSGLPGI